MEDTPRKPSSPSPVRRMISAPKASNRSLSAAGKQSREMLTGGACSRRRSATGSLSRESSKKPVTVRVEGRVLKARAGRSPTAQLTGGSMWHFEPPLRGGSSRGVSSSPKQVARETSAGQVVDGPDPSPMGEVDCEGKGAGCCKVAGLAKWLALMDLGEYYPEAIAWCNQMGACCIDEILVFQEEFGKGLDLKP